jgi:hypothetical protein
MSYLCKNLFSKFIVKSVCLINEKQSHVGNIKDFSQFDLSKIEKIKLPQFRRSKFLCEHVSAEEKADFEAEFKDFGTTSNFFNAKEFLEVASMSDDAFDDVANNLTYLHLRFTRNSSVFNFNFNNLTKLTELCIECEKNENLGTEPELRNPKYLKSLVLPTSLEMLSLIGFNLDLKAILPTNLTNLKHLELNSIDDVIMSDPRPFECFKNLTQLHFEYVYVTLKKSCLRSKEKIQMGSENVETLELQFRYRNDAMPILCFDKLSKLKRVGF